MYETWVLFDTSYANKPQSVAEPLETEPSEQDGRLLKLGSNLHPVESWGSCKSLLVERRGQLPLH